MESRNVSTSSQSVTTWVPSPKTPFINKTALPLPHENSSTLTSPKQESGMEIKMKLKASPSQGEMLLNKRRESLKRIHRIGHAEREKMAATKKIQTDGQGVPFKPILASKMAPKSRSGFFSDRGENRAFVSSLDSPLARDSSVAMSPDVYRKKEDQSYRSNFYSKCHMKYQQMDSDFEDDEDEEDEMNSLRQLDAALISARFSTPSSHYALMAKNAPVSASPLVSHFSSLSKTDLRSLIAGRNGGKV